MADKLKAKVIIEAEGNKAVKEAKKVQKELRSTGEEGKKAGSKIDSGAEKGKQGLQKLGDESQETKRDMTALGVSVLGLGASITGLSDAIFGMKEKMIALRRSQFGLKETTEDLTRQKEDLIDALKEGTLAGRDYERALKDIKLTAENLTIEQAELKAETEALNSEWLTFGVNTINTVMFTMIAMTTVLSADTKAKIVNHAVTKGLTTATILFSKALWKIAKHPAFLIAAAGVAVWEANLFNLRGELEKMSGQSLGIIDNIQNMTDSAFGAADSTDELTRKIEENNSGIDDWAKNLKRGSSSIDEFGSSAERATKSIKGFTQAQERLINSGSLKGFRSGGATSLSQAIYNEAGEIELATARTLTAASLHDALKSMGWTGEDSRSRNISGTQSIIDEILDGRIDFRKETYDGQSIDYGFLQRAIRGSKSSTSIFSGVNAAFTSSAASQVGFSPSGATRSSVRYGGGGARGRAGGHNPLRRDRQSGRTRIFNNEINRSLSDQARLTGLNFTYEYYTSRARGGNYGSYANYKRTQANIALENARRVQQVRDNVAEANTRVSLINQIRNLDPFLIPNDSIFRSSSSTLRGILETEQKEISTNASILGLNQTNIISLQSTQQGVVQLNGMLDFKDRMGLISGGVV